jgi:hypothetical protein
LLAQPVERSDSVKYLINYNKTKAKELVSLCDRRLAVLAAFLLPKQFQDFRILYPAGGAILSDLAHVMDVEAMFSACRKHPISSSARKTEEIGEEQYDAIESAKEITGCAREFRQ